MGAPAAPGHRWARGAALAALAAGAARAALSAALLAAVLQAEREITVVNGNLHHRGYEDSPSAVLKTLEATREVRRARVRAAAPRRLRGACAPRAHVRVCARERVCVCLCLYAGGMR